MTNAEIIYRTSMELVKEGVLKTITISEQEMPEPIHTFQKWKSLGYSVKKGEKSDIKFPIWKYTSKKKDDESDEEDGSMFMKMSAFFRFSQVEKIKEA